MAAVMLGALVKSVWRTVTGSRNAGTELATGGSAVEAQVRAAFAAMVREPLAHPKNIDYEMMAHFMAAAGSAEYMVHRMMSARNLIRRELLMRFALDQCTIEGLVMEFGVYRGDSLRAIARSMAQEVHGFDSFEGLPDDWTYFQKQGRFSLNGQMPHFEEPNVRIHHGWFDQTLPRFLADNAASARFVHIDCDVYTSTRTVLNLLKSRITSGTVIVFDEYLNYPGWREHEFKAFQEFVSANGISYRYIGFASSECAVAITIN